MDKSVSIPFPDWHGKSVVIARAPARSLYVYLPEGFKTLEEKIDYNAARYALSYLRFREFMRAGLLKAEIGSKGVLTLPEFLYTYLGEKGELEVRRGQHSLELKRVYEGMCRCDDRLCAKCLAAGCQDDECPTHTREAKVRRRA